MIIKTKDMNFLRLLMMAIITFGLAACGSLLDTGQDASPDSIYDLEPLASAGSGEDPATLLLAVPSHPAFLGTNKIVVKPGGQEIQFLAGARWSDNAPALVSRHLMVSLENGGGFNVQTARQTALPHQYRLLIDIRDFSAHVNAGGPPTAVMELEVSFLDAKTLEIISTRNFSKNISAGENSKAAIAGAFQRGMDEIAREMKDWLSASK